MKPTVLVLILMLTTSTRSFAQGVSVSPKGVRLMGYGDVDVDATIERWLEIETRKIDTLVHLQIECLTQECELSPVQIELERETVCAIPCQLCRAEFDVPNDRDSSWHCRN